MSARAAKEVVVVAAACALFAACRTLPDPNAHDASTVDAPATIDASDGIGCAVTTPRTVAPQAFVGPGGLSDRLSALIDSAQRSLDLQMYLFDDPTIAEHVVAAYTRGVHVRVILDASESGNADVRAMLVANGLEVRSAPAVFTYSHAKYMVIDGVTGVIMSMNFNTDAMTTERNYGFVDRDPDDVADLVRIFTMDWATANGDAPAFANLACTRLIVSPVNSLQRVTLMIDTTEHTLDIEAMYLVSDYVDAAVTAAAMRGVTIRVMLEDPTQQEGNDTTAAALANLGIPVKYATSAQFYLHAKLMIADGIAFVGSENYSQTSLVDNREVGGMLFEPDAVALIQDQFDADWGATVPATGSN